MILSSVDVKDTLGLLPVPMTIIISFPYDMSMIVSFIVYGDISEDGLGLPSWWEDEEEEEMMQEDTNPPETTSKDVEMAPSSTMNDSSSLLL